MADFKNAGLRYSRNIQKTVCRLRVLRRFCLGAARVRAAVGHVAIACLVLTHSHARAQGLDLAVGAMVLPRSCSVQVYSKPSVDSGAISWPTSSVAMRVLRVDGEWLQIANKWTAFWASQSDVVAAEAAVDLFSANVRLSGTTFDYVCLGVALSLEGKLDESDHAFAMALSIDPHYSVGHLERGVAYAVAHKSELALAELSAAIRSSPSYVDAYVARGDVLMDQRRLESAVADFDEAIRLAPEDAAGYYGRGLANIKSRKYQLAIVDLDTAIRLAPTSSDAYCDRGVAWSRLDHRLGNEEKALSDYNNALRLNARHSRALRNRASIYNHRRNFAEALADYSAAVQLNSSDPTALVARGVFLAQRGDFHGARVDLEEAIRLNPCDASAYATRGALSLIRGESKEAIKDIQVALKSDPANVTALIASGLASAALGELPKAIADFSEAIRLDEAATVAYTNRAACRFLAGDQGGAQDDWATSFDLESDQPGAYRNRARLWLDQDDPRRALRDWDAAIRLEPAAPGGLLGRAATFAMLNRYEDAFDDIREALRLWPSGCYCFAVRAWVRANRPDRSDKELNIAVEDARTACRLSKSRNPACLSILAAISSWTGDFEAATKYEYMASQLLLGHAKVISTARLEKYKARTTAPLNRYDYEAAHVEMQMQFRP